MNYFGEYDSKNSKKHLSCFEVNGTKRSLYTSVSFCNRCGMCGQVCPSYQFTQEEPLSPRGRNQAIRLLLEGKIKLSQNRPLLTKMAASCTLCGKCTAVCAGNIPTAQHVLELRRLLGKKVLPFTLFYLLKLRQKFPSFFGKLMRAGLQLRRVGLVKFIRFSGLANLLGCAWLHGADKLIPDYSKQAWKQLQNTLLNTKSKKPTLIYLPSFEAAYFLPHVQQSVLQTLLPKYPLVCWQDTPSGLFEFVYGDLRQARKQLKHLITRHEQTGNGHLKLVTDSIDVYHFFQKIPLLFPQDYWHNKAKNFVKHVCFITDFLPPQKVSLSAKTPVCLDYTSLFLCQSTPFEQAQKYLCKNLGNLVQCTYQVSMGGFGYEFVSKALFQTIQTKALAQLEQTDVKTLVTLSGLAQMQWMYALKQRPHKTLRVFYIAQLNGTDYGSI